MRAKRLSRKLTLLAIGTASLALVGAGCGDDDEEKTANTSQSKTSPVQAAESQLTPFLMRDGEEPGFRRVDKPIVTTGVDAFVSEMRLSQGDARRLRSDGHVAFVAQPISGPRTAGITNVELFETAEGAKRNLAHELRPSVIRSLGPVEGLRFFTVPGVPGARGWSASEPDVANALWVQGRCMFVLGNQGPGRLTDRLSKGVRAIYERTNGQCP